VADLTEFVNAEIGISRSAVPKAKFAFKGNSEIGEATFVVDPGETVEDGLTRWAGTVLGLDQAGMDLLEILEVRAWGPSVGDAAPYRYVKARVRKQDTGAAAVREAADRWLARHPRRPRKAKPPASGKNLTPCAEWWPLSDTQIGKGGEERFGGLSETMARLNWTEQAFTEYHQQVRKAGYQPQRIILPLAGDLTEGCSGSYDNQEFITSLNAADQLELAIAAVDQHIEAALDLAPEVVITGVASNHDRQSRVGKRENITDAWDDRTFVLLRSLARVYAKVGGDRLRVVMPNNPHVAVIEDGFLTVATIHGHKPKYRSTAPNTMWDWWQSEIAAHRDAAAAQVLLAGHYHHSYHLGPQSGRLLIGLPSLDGGSQWFEATGGDWSLPGVSPFLTTANGVRRLENLVWEQDRQVAQEFVGAPVA
jgi:hypothetical protein